MTTTSSTTLSTLAVEINEHHRAAEDAASNALEHAYHAGILLNRAKRQCEHGEWASWLKANFDGSIRTAQVYMQIGDPFNWERIQKRNTVAHLKVDATGLFGVGKAVKLLAKPRRSKVQPDPSEDPIDVPVDDHVDKPVDAQADTKQITPTPCPNCGSTDRLEDDLGRCCARCKDPCDSDDEAVKPERKVQGKGIFLAHEAINCLQRIPKNDPFRKRAAEIVRDWIARNLEGEA